MNLQVEDVVIALSGTPIVRGASLEVAPGSIVGLVGLNGSGKSTLLRGVYRLLRPHAGVVRLGGDDVWQLAARESARRTGVVVQETPSDFDFTVREVAEMGRTPHKGMLERDTAADAAIVASAAVSRGRGRFRRAAVQHAVGRRKAARAGGARAGAGAEAARARRANQPPRHPLPARTAGAGARPPYHNPGDAASCAEPGAIVNRRRGSARASSMVSKA